MAWWQKKLLRYALSRTGLLDDNVLDLDNLGITLGKKNVVELKDVGLNIKRISKLAQLPPGLRVETARVLLLRLTVPADIYQSSIVAEVDGVELRLVLEESEAESPPKQQKRKARSPVTARSPQHRKAHRRLHSPPPYDPGGLSDSEDGYLPTTEELAKSFLQEEPVRERRELEASVAANTKDLEESIVSESSEGDDLGTGAVIGLPGFLAGFLQGIADRLQIRVKNAEARLETEVSGDGQQPVPVILHLHVGHAELESASFGDAGEEADQIPHGNRRRINLQDLSLNLLSDAAIFSDLSELPSQASPSQSRRSDPSSPPLKSSSSSKAAVSHSRPATSSNHQSSGSTGRSSARSPDAMGASLMSTDTDRFADAGEEELRPELQASQSELDIQPGDDNISWGSRRSKSNAPSEDLWNSMASEDDLTDSLLLERASTPRAHSSRGQSPTMTRTHRDVSPYSQVLQSPGSWPRMDESPQRHRLQQSPGSWPTLDQSQRSIFQSMTADQTEPFEDATDNKRAAIEASVLEGERPSFSAEPSDTAVEDLAASRVFSHEEAESMYMSAMTHSPRMQMHMPGGWSEGSPSESSSSPEASRQPSLEPTRHDHSSEHIDDGLAYGERPYSTPVAPLSGNVTPRAKSPEPAEAVDGAQKSEPRVSKQLLYVDTVSSWLPTTHGGSGDEEYRGAPATSASTSFAPQNMPGTFSAYSEMTASNKRHARLGREGSSSVDWAQPPQETSRRDDRCAPLGLEIGVVKCQFDVPSGRLLYRLTTKAMAVLNLENGHQSKHQKSTVEQIGDRTSISVSIRDVWVALRSSADTSLSTDDANKASADSAITLNCRNIECSTSPGDVDLRIGSFRTLLGTSCFLSFNRSRDMKTSMIISEQTPDIALVLTTRETLNRRPITKIVVETLPLDVLLDLPIIDEAFTSFGGLSGVLEAGNSILSESGVGNSPLSASKPIKGVRFEGDPQYIGAEPELKIDARVGGVDATLQGNEDHVQLQTTKVKVVYREQGAIVTMEQVTLTGPFGPRYNSEPLLIDISTLRLEYLLSPQDHDLERLLSLLTPSKDKYDNDDDILIDTLVRQRKKGAVARAFVTSIKLECHDWACVSALSTLGDELSKLSAVAKYLPEDDRPGLLTLLCIKDLSARLPVNERFGDLDVNVADLHCAHVGLPALLAVEVGSIKASYAEGVELLHSLVPLVGSERLPMVMARMLGDEVEPTVKVKLFNVCVEYSVPAIIALTGLDKEADTEEVVAELAKSVANLALPHDDNGGRTPGSGSDTSTAATKKLNVDLLIHDSAVGLNPEKLSSKGLLVFTDALFSSTLPPEDTLAATIELRKAGLFVADHVILNGTEETRSLRGSPRNTATKPKLTTALSKQGFVSVGSIMAAKISVKVEESNTEAKSVDVDVKNELLLLETCADSTQTLIATLNGLMPPTPPSKQPKYLTEPMTIEDMMASFTGDAFAKPDKPPETLFDVEEQPSDDPELMLDIPTLGEDDDDGLLADSEMTSSLYGPIGSMLEGVDKPEDEDASEDFPETAESLLEDDPFEMTSSPTDAPLSDSALVKELNKQRRPAVKDEPVDLGLYEVEDLGLDALGGNQRALGTQYRFNTPVARGYKAPAASKHRDLPFRLKLRDLHIIWNIYDGYDWQRTRDGITEAVEQVETRAEQRRAKRRQSQNEREDEESVIGDFLFNSIYIGVPSNHDAQELRRQINRNIDDLASETESVPVSGMSRPTIYSASGRPAKQRQQRRLNLERSKAHKVAFELKGVSADVLVFPPDSADVVSSVDVRVKDFEIFDNVPTSTWKKFLTHLDNDPSAREMSKPMMHIELLNVRTLENFAASEIVMHVSVLPLRLHVDQDALDFITRFFEFKDKTAIPDDSSNEQPFLQRVEVDTVDMCLDYKPKKVDYAGIRSGHTTEFMNFIILDAANIRLKHAIVYGIKGFEPLHKTLNDVWMPDIQRNQLPTVLAGLAPVRSLVNIGTGVRDVVAIPVREYRKDGRIVRSIQKGAFHFGKTTASELARLGAKVAIGTQNLLQGAEGFLTPMSSSPSGRPGAGRRLSSEQGWHDVGSEDEEHEARAISAYANQPLGVLSGLRSARRYLEHDLLTARDALIAVQGEVLESSSPGSAAAAVAKHAPTVILRPIIGTSRAVGTALLGVGNQIDRGNVRRIEDVSTLKSI